jgi:hypothetical protein
VSERHAEAAVELRELLYDMRRAGEDSHYGYFCGGDPNDFSPDPEASTDEERACHKGACEAWNAGKGNPNPAPHCAWMSGGIAPPGFGLGVQTMRDEQAEDWAERLERCINRLEGE